MTVALAEKPATKRTRKAGKPAPDSTTPAGGEAVQDDQAVPAVTPDAETQPAPATEPVVEWDHAAVRLRREGPGLSRTALAELTGLSGSRIWASEAPGKALTAEHMQSIRDALAQVEEHGVPEQYKKKPSGFAAKGTGPTKTELEARLKTVLALLDQARPAKTLGASRAVVEQAIAAGAPGPSRRRRRRRPMPHRNVYVIARNAGGRPTRMHKLVDGQASVTCCGRDVSA
jgi:hypothetical protein